MKNNLTLLLPGNRTMPTRNAVAMKYVCRKIGGIAFHIGPTIHPDLTSSNTKRDNKRKTRYKP